MADSSASPKKKGFNRSRATAEARALIWTHRRSLAIGFVLMLINRLSGLVLPASSKFLIDDVLVQKRSDLLTPLALAVGAATIVQAITSYAQAQVVSIAAQRAITDMRIAVQRHILRLPVSFFDSTKTGILISRIMTDAEGIRNLVGTAALPSGTLCTFKLAGQPAAVVTGLSLINFEPDDESPRSCEGNT